METALAIVGSYLLGSVSFGIAISRLAGLPDPRTYGSKNPGATNVLRSGRKVIAALTLAGDAGKGFIAVWLALLFAPWAAVYAGVAVFLGHLYPVFHRFQGGKGVATAAGVLFGFNVWLGLGTLVTWIVIAAFFRYASLASLVAAAFAVFFTAFMKMYALLPAVAVIAALTAWRHEGNIRRLLAGTESRLGEKKASPPPDPSAASR